MDIILLGISALVTSIVAGCTGMAGGVLLFSVMILIMPSLRIIVPIHGVVQLFSNGFRVIALHGNVHIPTVKVFALGSVLGGGIGWFLVQRIDNPKIFLVIVCALILYVVFKPSQFRDIKLPPIGFFLLGVIAAILAPLIGTVGPILAPFFVRDDFSKESIVATKATAQAISHAIKLPIFLSLQFPYQQYLWHMMLMIGAAYVGTAIGVHILHKINRAIFMRFVKITMFLIALRLIYRLLVD